MAITFWIGCRRSIGNLDQIHGFCNVHSLTLKDKNTQKVIEKRGVLTVLVVLLKAMSIFNGETGSLQKDCL